VEELIDTDTYISSGHQVNDSIETEEEEGPSKWASESKSKGKQTASRYNKG